jgi:hypothetical protein
MVTRLSFRTPSPPSNLLFAGNSFGSPGSAEAEQPLGYRENPQETDKDDDKQKGYHLWGASFLQVLPSNIGEVALRSHRAHRRAGLWPPTDCLLLLLRGSHEATGG